MIFKRRSKPNICMSHKPLQAILITVKADGSEEKTVFGDVSDTCKQCGKLWSEH